MIPSDDNNKFSDEGTSSMRSRPCKVSHTTPGKAAKRFIEAPSAKARDFAVKGGPTPAPLTMDDNDAYVGEVASNAVSKPCLTAVAATRAMAFANNVLVSGQVIASLRTKQSSGDPWKVGGAVPACDEPNNRTHQLPNDRTHRLLAKAAGGSAPPGDDLAPSGVSTATGGNEEDKYDDIPEQPPHGMANLRAAMAVEGTTAFRFADAIKLRASAAAAVRGKVGARHGDGGARMRPDDGVAAAAQFALGVEGRMPDNEGRAALESLPGAKVVRRALAALCNDTNN